MSALPVTTPGLEAQPAAAQAARQPLTPPEAASVANVGPQTEAANSATIGLQAASVAQVAAPQAEAANSATVTLPEAANDSAMDASRAPVTPPEARDTALLPPETPPLVPQGPTPPKVAEAMGAAANDVTPKGHDSKALKIEENIARFVGDRLPAEFRTGLMVDVVLANSNAVTGEEKGAHDIAIVFKGGQLENPKNADKVAALLRGALREHPAFSEMSFGGIDEKIEHMMRCQILSLSPEQLTQLLTPQPAKRTTFVSASETNASTAVAQTPVKDAAEAATASAHQCDGHCNHAPVSAATTVAATEQPANSVTAPAIHQGQAAAVPQQAATPAVG